MLIIILSCFVALRWRYNKLLHIQNNSVKKQLSILIPHLPPQYRCLVIHTLKSQANPDKEDDRCAIYKKIVCPFIQLLMT